MMISKPYEACALMPVIASSLTECNWNFPQKCGTEKNWVAWLSI